MKDAFRKVAVNVLLGTNVLTFGYGTFLSGQSVAREYITEKADFNQAKTCIETLKADGNCTKDAYVKVARMTENEQKFGFGLAITFATTVSFGTLVPLAASVNRRKSQPKKDAPKDAPKS